MTTEQRAQAHRLLDLVLDRNEGGNDTQMILGKESLYIFKYLGDSTVNKDFESLYSYYGNSLEYLYSMSDLEMNLLTERSYASVNTL